MSEKRKSSEPWMARLDKAREERAMRAAKTLGLVGHGAKTRLVRIGLDLACMKAIRRQLDEMGGLVAAARAETRGLRQILLDAVAVTAGAELALLDLLGVTADEWGQVLTQYPDVAKAYAAELSKREGAIL
jgi:hypothetical protein